MKDIELNNLFLKIQYWISWFGFIVFGVLIVWFIALGLVTYGKNTSYNVSSKKDVLNKTWQKFVFIYGSILGDLVIIIAIIRFFTV